MMKYQIIDSRGADALQRELKITVITSHGVCELSHTLISYMIEFGGISNSSNNSLTTSLGEQMIYSRLQHDV